MKFEWIEEGDGRYRVQFLTWMKRRYSTLRLPTIVIRTGSNQTWNGTTSLCTDHSLHNRSRPDPGNHPVAICLLYHHADPRGHHL